MAAMPVRAGPRADPGVLVVLAACCRDDEVVSFDYRGRGGDPGARRVQPHSLVVWQGLWYLVAFDPDRAGWRTFRVDRITGAARTFRRFEPRELPAVDAASYVAESFAGARYRHTARLTVGLAADAVRDGVFASVPGEVEAVGPAGCVVRLTAETPELVVQFVLAIAALGAEFTVEASPAVVDRIRVVGVRLTGRVS
jgi:predicted DNA-binding transcriptional regulator YafY